MPTYRRLLSLTILTLLLVSSLPISFSPVVQAAPGIKKIQGPKTPVIAVSDISGYSLMATNENYKAYFKANSRTSRAFLIQKSGYSFELDIRTSQLRWYSSSLDAIVGMTQEMNPQNTAISTSGASINYANAWISTDLRYSASVDSVKDTLIIRAISPPTSAVGVDYLQYVANCYYTNTLTIVANGVSYLHPVNQKFTTSGEILFNDPNGKLVFALPIPYIFDSSANTNPSNQPPSNMRLGIYAVTANNGVLIINIRIPKSFIDVAVFPLYFDPPIRVQGNARGTSTTTPISVTMGSPPTNGNVLVAVISTFWYSGLRTVSSITQTGVAWTQQATVNDGYRLLDIWFGVVGAGANTAVSIALSGDTNGGSVADICEYSGVLTTGFLDKNASSSGYGTTAVTGTTATTTQASELWVGGVMSRAETHTSPTNGFTQLDGATYTNNALSYLEKIVSSTGAASSGVTLGGADYWLGCIAAFKAVTITDYPRAGTLSLTLGKTGTRLLTSTRVATGVFTLASAGTRLIGIIRAAAQGFTFASLTTRLAEALRDVSQGIIWKGDALAIFSHHFLVTISQGITLAVDAARQIDWFRDTSQGFILSMGGVGYLAIKYIVSVTQNIIIKSLGYGVLNLPVPGSVVTVVEGGLLWGIIIFLIVLIVAAFRR